MAMNFNREKIDRHLPSTSAAMKMKTTTVNKRRPSATVTSATIGGAPSLSLLALNYNTEEIARDFPTTSTAKPIKAKSPVVIDLCTPPVKGDKKAKAPCRKKLIAAHDENGMPILPKDPRRKKRKAAQDPTYLPTPPTPQRVKKARDDKDVPHLKKHKAALAEDDLLRVKKPKTAQVRIDAPRVKKPKTTQAESDAPRIMKPKVAQVGNDVPRIKKPKVAQDGNDAPRVKKPKTTQAENDAPRIKKPKTTQAESDASRVKKPKAALLQNDASVPNKVHRQKKRKVVQDPEYMPTPPHFEKLKAAPARTVVHKKPRVIAAPEGKLRRPLHSSNSRRIHIESQDCALCAAAKPVSKFVRIDSCQHDFCHVCLRRYVKCSKTPQIGCPLSEEGKCNGVLSDPEIKALVTDEVFEKYLSRSLAIALKADGQMTHCFAPGCPGICVVEGARLFYCPLCTKRNCMGCKSTHEGPCPKKRRKGAAAQNDAAAAPFLGAIAMIPPKPETEEEMKIRLEWEASWAQLTSKLNSEKQGAGAARPATPSKLFADLIATDHIFECPICMVDVEVGEGVILQDCFHRFCRDCLAGSIEHSDGIRVKCPYQSGTYSCQMHISDREVRSLARAEVYEKLLKKSLAAAEMGMSNAFRCQSVNCTGWAEVVSNHVTTFRCFICLKANCVQCKAIHDSLSCADYQRKLKEGEFELVSKEALNLMIKNGEAMKCPTCKVVIIKNGGCDGMTCTVCQTHICWATKGPRWGPKGRGDDSAGCRCGFDGKKCHPKCGNCH